MNKNFSISIGTLGIKSTKEFMLGDLNLLQGIITADRGAIKELKIFLKVSTKKSMLKVSLKSLMNLSMIILLLLIGN